MHTSVAFDLTVTGLLAPLLVGGTVRWPPRPASRAWPARWPAAAASASCSLTPSHLDLLARLRRRAELAGRARDLVIGGEALTAADAPFWRAHAPETR